MARSCSDALQRVAAHRSSATRICGVSRAISRRRSSTAAASPSRGVTSSRSRSIGSQNIDAITAHRFAANYTDEAGIVRFGENAPAADSPQLGLPLEEEDN